MTERKPIAKRGSRAEDAARTHRLFAEEYMRNGNNATAAARAVGYKGSTVRDWAHKMLHQPDVQAYIAERAQKVAADSKMDTATWAKQVMAIVTSSVGDLVDETGAVRPLHTLPPAVQAAVASFEMDATGKAKVKFWDKNAALQTMARHLGLFERDNQQLQPNVTVKVELVG